MKTNRYILFLILALFGASIGSYAQSTATANISATIVTPITISKVQDMNFGDMSVVSGQGSVTLSPAANSRLASGGVELMDATNVSFASFKVSGAIGATFSISLPQSPVLLSNGESTMTVSEFTSTPTATSGLTNGTKSILVGATLHVNGSQALGTYQSVAPFPVTVNYN
jgi:hypothetical protein